MESTKSMDDEDHVGITLTHHFQKYPSQTMHKTALFDNLNQFAMLLLIEPHDIHNAPILGHINITSPNIHEYTLHVVQEIEKQLARLREKGFKSLMMSPLTYNNFRDLGLLDYPEEQSSSTQVMVSLFSIIPGLDTSTIDESLSPDKNKKTTNPPGKSI